MCPHSRSTANGVPHALAPLLSVLLLPLAASASLATLDVTTLKGASCIIQDSTLASETVLAPEVTRVNIVLSDGQALATVTQMFVNPLSTTTQIAYVFPLPEDGSVHAMAFQSGGKLYRAHIEDRDSGIQRYDSAKAAGSQAGILLQERSNLFQQKLANLGPGDTVYVEIKLVTPLNYADGWYELAFPTMVGARYSSDDSSEPTGTVTGWNPPAEREGPAFQFNVLVQSGSTFDSIVSPTHPIDVSDLDASAVSELVARNVVDSGVSLAASFGKAIWLTSSTTYPNSDYVLRLHRDTSSGAASFVSCRPAGSDTGYFRATLFPDLSRSGQETPVDVVLLIDRSGSQYGWPLDDEKAIANRILDHLTAADALTVLAFENTIDYALGTSPVAATSSNIATARTFIQSIEAYGGTELLSAIQASLAIPPTENRQRLYVFLTDGFITNESAILEALQQADTGSSSLQVFTFGCGNSLNRSFLESAAEVGNGFATILVEADDPDSATDAAWSRISAPQIRNLSLQVAGVPTYDLVSGGSAVLYRGLPWSVSGKYVGKGDTTLTLSGLREDSTWSQSTPVTFAGSCPADRTVPLTWARIVIDSLETAEGTTTANRARIVALSEQYQVLSKYTAFLALDGVDLAEAGVDLSDGLSTLGLESSRTAVSRGLASLAILRRAGAMVFAWRGDDTPRAWILTDLRGREIARWGALQEVRWDGRDRHGAVVPAGAYLLRVVTTAGVATATVGWTP